MKDSNGVHEGRIADELQICKICSKLNWKLLIFCQRFVATIRYSTIFLTQRYSFAFYSSNGVSRFRLVHGILLCAFSLPISRELWHPTGTRALSRWYRSVQIFCRLRTIGALREAAVRTRSLGDGIWWCLPPDTAYSHADSPAELHGDLYSDHLCCNRASGWDLRWMPWRDSLWQPMATRWIKWPNIVERDR